MTARHPWPEWTPEALSKIRPEFDQVPACRECGRVPTQYARFSDGSVECIGRDKAACLAVAP